jgi:2-polyprenyl-3-methyl-5-hydroxy-6-metoxy-1,4-benzoquinol methylase
MPAVSVATILIAASLDELAGSCQELLAYSDGKGLSSHEEIVLDIGTGQGILYQPLDKWIIPTVQWAVEILD